MLFSTGGHCLFSIKTINLTVRLYQAFSETVLTLTLSHSKPTGTKRPELHVSFLCGEGF